MAVVADVGPPAAAPTLRKLYVTRFGFAVVWAVLLVATAADLGLAAGVLLVLYPLFDVASAVVDARSTSAGGRLPGALVLNIVVSSAAAIGLAVAATSGIPAALRVWGVWAIVAGIVQLVVAVRRRQLGGQWAMIASGGISVLAGSSFIATAGTDDPKLTNVAGYAVAGGIFFLISALRLGRTPTETR